MDSLLKSMGDISLPELLKVNSALLQTMSEVKSANLDQKYTETMPLRDVVRALVRKEVAGEAIQSG